MTSRFTKGTGCYTCNACGRKTRETDQDATQAHLCAQCWELAGLENEVSDNGITEGPEIQRIDAMTQTTDRTIDAVHTLCDDTHARPAEWGGSLYPTRPALIRAAWVAYCQGVGPVDLTADTTPTLAGITEMVAADWIEGATLDECCAALGVASVHYEIVTRREDGAWANDEVGGPNCFDTEGEARAAIEALRPILVDDDGEQAEYDVRPIEEA